MGTNDQISIRPTFSGSFDNGWETMKKYFLPLLLVVIVLGVIMSPTQAFRVNYNVDHFDWHNIHNFDFFNSGMAALGIIAIIFGIFIFVYGLLIVPIFQFGGNLIFVQAVRNIRPEFENLIKGFKENYLHIVLANLLTAALVMMGIIFLIVPGIIIGCRLAFVSYLIMDKKLDPIVAVEESWKLTKGHAWTIFGMGFVSIFIFILGLIMCFVGVFPALIWIKSSFASLYQAVLIEKNGNNNMVAE